MNVPLRLALSAYSLLEECKCVALLVNCLIAPSTRFVSLDIQPTRTVPVNYKIPISIILLAIELMFGP